MIEIDERIHSYDATGDFQRLKKNGKDNVLQTIDNCVFILEHDETLRGAIRFNVLTERDCIVRDVG